MSNSVIPDNLIEIAKNLKAADPFPDTPRGWWIAMHSAIWHQYIETLLDDWQRRNMTFAGRRIWLFTEGDPLDGEIGLVDPFYLVALAHQYNTTDDFEALIKSVGRIPLTIERPEFKRESLLNHDLFWFGTKWGF